MVSINTNISSLMVQNNLSLSTNALNQAIERMTTGFKINHASDNAANYSISQNMDSKISSYNIAYDNVSMGLDMMSSTNDTLDLITSHLQRIRDLSMQASNGTYGDASIEAINAEICARVDEIQRISANAEYNGINLFKGTVAGTESSSFIKDIDRRNTDNMTALSSIDPAQKLESGTYSISTAAEMAQLATMTNNGLIGVGTEFVMANDIDLSAYSNWTPIGKTEKDAEGNTIVEKTFRATFDGNGYKITGLTINLPDEERIGLFGYCAFGGTISNLNVENASVYGGTYSGIIAGTAAMISNCYTSGSISNSNSNSRAGGIVGNISGYINDCYSTATLDVYAGGGIAGYLNNGDIENCYYNGTISATNFCGGICAIIRHGSPSIRHCYSMGNINGGGRAGGIVGLSDNLVIDDCYTSMNIQGTGTRKGGILGSIYYEDSSVTITNCAVLNSSSSLNGLFVGERRYASDGITIENSSYNSAITSPTKYVGNMNNSDVNATGITTNDGTAPFVISNNANINLYNDTMAFQVGINGDESSQISLTMGYRTDKLVSLKAINSNGRAQQFLSYIDGALSQISAKQTEYGAAQNRLESALESISVATENLTSSRSTIRDADIAKESSAYIKSQILQQASATLLATANQTPAITLTLLSGLV